MQVWALDGYCPSLPTRTAQTEWSEGQTEKHFLMELKNSTAQVEWDWVFGREKLSAESTAV